MSDFKIWASLIGMTLVIFFAFVVQYEDHIVVIDETEIEGIYPFAAPVGFWSIKTTHGNYYIEDSTANYILMYDPTQTVTMSYTNGIGLLW